MAATAVVDPRTVAVVVMALHEGVATAAVIVLAPLAIARTSHILGGSIIVTRLRSFA